MEINEITHFLPPISTETEETSFGAGREERLDLMAYAIEFKRQMIKENYPAAIDAATHILDILKEHPELITWKPDESIANIRGQRAFAYFMGGNYEAAGKDLQWIEAHADLSTERQAQKLRGIIEYLAGKGTALLEAAANRGDLMALLVLNQPENTTPPKTEWLNLNQKDKIQKLIEGRHYASLIEEINQMEFPNHRWFSEDSEERNYLALRGVCHALRGHYELAVQDLDSADRLWFQRHGFEKALVYAQAGQKEDALKILNKEDTTWEFIEGSWLNNFPAELVRQLVRK